MRKYHRLTRENRYQIEALLRSKIGVRAISRVMGVAPSTISRELQKRGPGAYWAGHAHRREVGVETEDRASMKFGRHPLVV